jgi:hypothetical protein
MALGVTVSGLSMGGLPMESVVTWVLGSDNAEHRNNMTHVTCFMQTSWLWM